MMLRTTLLGVLGVLTGMLCAATARGATEGPKPPDQPMTTLKMRAKSITFDQKEGKMLLKGDAHVVRTTGDDVLTMDCDEMTGVMKDDKLQTVHAVGNVKLKTKDYDATAQTADLDFDKNIIQLYGDDKKPASMTTTTMTSTGPEIICHLDDKKVELPRGGDTVVKMGNEAAAKTYVCPMHPDVSAKQPGKCPKCGMEMVEKK